VSTTYKNCPYCKEQIRAEAVKCRFCGEWLKKQQVDSVAEASGHLLPENEKEVVTNAFDSVDHDAIQTKSVPETVRQDSETARWHYKYGLSCRKVSNLMSLERLIMETRAGLVEDSTPVNRDGWGSYKRAKDVPELQDALKNQIGISWLNFWTYFRLPAGLVLFGLYGHLYARSPLGIIYLAYFVVVAATVVGLHERSLWGWKLNWVVLFGEWLLMPLRTIRFESQEFFGSYSIMLVMLGIVWVLPNFIYFKKRRCVFT
jgi:hypothetical protein